jgi:hypothetical protein
VVRQVNREPGSRLVTSPPLRYVRPPVRSSSEVIVVGVTGPDGTGAIVVTPARHAGSRS